MNPHYHPYGGPAELTSPHPPSPDNNNYHGHTGGPPGPISRMHPANGHAIGSIGLLSGPHHHDQHPHSHHPHPAFGSGGGGGGPPSSDGPHHQQQHHNPSIANNNNNNNGTVKICAGCGGKIVERFLLHALDRYWHNGCLKCTCCGAMLADIGTSCFTRGGMILCKQDYMRMFGSSGACSACGQTIPASELVMRSGGGSGPGAQSTPGAPLHVFHLKCFMCSKCLAPLVPGDRYYMLAGSLVCEQDWHKLLKSSAAAPTVRKGKVGRPRRSRD
ncbi:LIM domain only protein 3 [Cylas formicarius]|uniref:LIM domain only protein 3 n=1 Tax=Cylas formicarius TaxID=197179 RepID=UPI002958A604|nr:LIM domain only protein 3 [Cylas formicarius]XP_060518483.1 LIM domain only protein 3 [Cylas formicarius]XP_060518484.1 LIM domain only protein 3 [Cylas formicarius]